MQLTNQSNLTVNLSKEYLSQIPIKRISEKDKQPFVALVDQILELKNFVNEIIKRFLFRLGNLFNRYFLKKHFA